MDSIDRFYSRTLHAALWGLLASTYLPPASASQDPTKTTTNSMEEVDPFPLQTLLKNIEKDSSLAFVKGLVQHGDFDLNLKDAEGHTPLDYINPKHKLYDWLYQCGARSTQELMREYSTALWTQTLNFTYHYGHKRLLTTGPSGNTYLVSAESFLEQNSLYKFLSGIKEGGKPMSNNDKKKLKAPPRMLVPKQLAPEHSVKFDLDMLHEKIARLESLSHGNDKSNYVIAGMSLLFETHISDQYEALFSFYRHKGLSTAQRQSSKARELDESAICRFESGQSGATLEEVGNGYKRIKALYPSAKKAQEIQRQKQSVEENISPEQLCQQYKKRWESAKRKPQIVQDIQNQVENNKNTILKAWASRDLHSLTDAKELAKEINEELLQSHYHGAIVDSEQTFLYHALYTGDTQEDDQASGESLGGIFYSNHISDQFMQLLDRYRTYKQYNALHAALDRSSYEKKLEDKIIQPQPIVGCIIHIQTTRELCASCAYSLGRELWLKDGGLSSLQEHIKDANTKENHQTPRDPFITFVVSCSRSIDKETVEKRSKKSQKKKPQQDKAEKKSQQTKAQERYAIREVKRPPGVDPNFTVDTYLQVLSQPQIKGKHEVMIQTNSDIQEANHPDTDDHKTEELETQKATNSPDLVPLNLLIENSHYLQKKVKP